MLIYYRFNNFCSFNCESEFSMSAPTGKVKKRFPDNYVETAEGFNLLKSAVIVGENAGGKSNFINSLKYLKTLFVTNRQVKSVRPYVNAASLNDEKSPVQKFELCFRTDNGKIYVYHLHLNESGIVYEELQTSVYKGYKQDKIEMRGDRAEMSDFPLYLNTVAGGLDRRDQTIGGFSFVVKIYALPVVEIIGQLLYLLGRYGFNAQFGDCL